MDSETNKIVVKDENILKKKRKKTFGPKIKITEWDKRNDFDIPSNLDEPDIVDYINSKPEITREELISTFKIEPAQSEKDLLNGILQNNPMLNIRKRDKDFLLRIKIKRNKLTKKFVDLHKAQEIRNTLLFYSISNDPKFQMHLIKRNSISVANKKKNEYNYE